MGLTSERVHVEGRDPLESRVHRLDELLREQIVHPDVSLGLRTPRQHTHTRHEGVRTRSDKEVGSGRVESDSLDIPLLLLERRLSLMLSELMNEHRSVTSYQPDHQYILMSRER